MRRLRYRGLLALIVAACLLVDAKAPAQQPSGSVPPIEELKRQLEAKRLEARQQSEAKRQLEAKQQLEAKRQSEAKQQSEATQQLEANLQSEAKQQSEAKHKPRETAATPAAPRAPASPASPADVARAPPIAKNISPVRLEPTSAAISDSCPYPAAALSRGDTGTVILLIYVVPDGRATDAKIETSSGSEVLDEAAASCVQEFGHFLPRRNGTRAEAGWFRMKFKWSFGE